MNWGRDKNSLLGCKLDSPGDIHRNGGTERSLCTFVTVEGETFKASMYILQGRPATSVVIVSKGG